MRLPSSQFLADRGEAELKIALAAMTACKASKSWHSSTVVQHFKKLTAKKLADRVPNQLQKRLAMEAEGNGARTKRRRESPTGSVSSDLVSASVAR